MRMEKRGVEMNVGLFGWLSAVSDSGSEKWSQTGLFAKSVSPACISLNQESEAPR